MPAAGRASGDAEVRAPMAIANLAEAGRRVSRASVAAQARGTLIGAAVGVAAVLGIRALVLQKLDSSIEGVLDALDVVRYRPHPITGMQRLVLRASHLLDILILVGALAAGISFQYPVPQRVLRALRSRGA
jgi:hypothetical protein